MGLFLTSVSLANDYRQLWHSGFRIGIEQLGAIANDSAVLLEHYRFQKRLLFASEWSTCDVPGRKPGTSTNVMIGILKLSKKRTNLGIKSLATHPCRSSKHTWRL